MCKNSIVREETSYGHTCYKTRSTRSPAVSKSVWHRKWAELTSWRVKFTANKSDLAATSLSCQYLWVWFVLPEIFMGWWVWIVSLMKISVGLFISLYNFNMKRKVAVLLRKINRLFPSLIRTLTLQPYQVFCWAEFCNHVELDFSSAQSSCVWCYTFWKRWSSRELNIVLFHESLPLIVWCHHKSLSGAYASICVIDLAYQTLMLR